MKRDCANWIGGQRMRQQRKRIGQVKKQGMTQGKGKVESWLWLRDLTIV